MKRTIIHTSAAIALLLGIAACTQDEAVRYVVDREKFMSKVR